MFKNEPFKVLPEAYIPSPDYNHHPPTLIFGFPISRDYKEFRKIALDEGLMSAEEVTKKIARLRLLVLKHLNEQCGLKAREEITGSGVSSLSTNFVLELKTNYEQLIPEDKMDKVMRVLRKYLPDTEPQWYLETDIDLKHIRVSPRELLVTDVTQRLTCVHQCLCSSGRSHQVYHSRTRTLSL